MKTYNFSEEYPWLSITTKFFRITSVLIIVGTIVMAVLTFTSMNSIRGFNVGILPIVYICLSGFLSASLFFAFAELIKVIVRIEFNTRQKVLFETQPSDQQRQHRVDVKSNLDDEPLDNQSYIEWKKDNPDKNINDYYSSMNK